MNIASACWNIAVVVHSPGPCGVIHRQNNDEGSVAHS